MIYIFHDTLFFVVDLNNYFGLLSFLKSFSKIIVVPSYIFVFSTISIKLDTSIWTVAYSRTFDSKINTHDIII